MTDDKLKLMIGALVLGVGLVLLWILVPETEYVDEVEIPVTLIPEGAPSEGEAAKLRHPPAEKSVVYIDASLSMQGFLPPEDDSKSAFATVVRSLGGHLVEHFGGEVEWKLIGDRPESLGMSTPTLTRAMLSRRRSSIELALEELIAGLEAGALDAGILVTDLVANGGLEGAMGAVGPLDEWVESPTVMSGQMDLMLTGARAPYFGFTASGCLPSREGLGCWWSEQSDSYEPLETRANRPFYILTFTRGEGAEDIRNSLLTAGFHKELEKIGFETRHDSLVRHDERIQGSVRCEFRGLASRRQRMLRRKADGSYTCTDEGEVLLECGLHLDSPDLISQRTVIATWWQPSWSAGIEPVDQGKPPLGYLLSCPAITRQPEEGSLILRPVEVRATLSSSLSNDWSDWSTASDVRETELSKTLQLDRFLDALLPHSTAYRVEVRSEADDLLIRAR